MRLTPEQIEQRKEQSDNLRGLASDLNISLPEALRLMEFSDTLQKEGLGEIEARRKLMDKLFEDTVRKAGEKNSFLDPSLLGIPIEEKG